MSTNANVNHFNDLDVTPYARQQIDAWDEYQRTGDGSKLNTLRTNSALPPESWESMDDSLYSAVDDALVVADYLRNNTSVVQESIYSKDSTWNVRMDDHEASIDMDPETATDEGSLAYGRDGVPLPIVHADFSIGFRDEAPQGQRLDGGLVQEHQSVNARAVGEKLEDLFLNGWDYSIGSKGYELFGLTNHPDIHTGTLDSWSDDSTIARENLRRMAQTLRDDNVMPGNGGFPVFISNDLEYHFDDIHDILEEPVRNSIENLNDIGSIQVSDYLPDGSALMFRPTPDVVDVAVAQEEATIQWDDPLRSRWKTMACMVPRIKSIPREDGTTQSGIAFFQVA